LLSCALHILNVLAPSGNRQLTKESASRKMRGTFLIATLY